MIEFSKIRQVFLDMDDTIYKGTTLFPCTKPFLAFLRERNIGYAFLSNNSSYSIGEYVKRLAGMGVEVTEQNFYNSTLYCIDYLHRNHPEYKKLYLLGMQSIVPEFENAGVIRQLENGTIHLIAILGFDFIQPGFRINVHGTEFPHVEYPAVQT